MRGYPSTTYATSYNKSIYDRKVTILASVYPVTEWVCYLFVLYYTDCDILGPSSSFPPFEYNRSSKPLKKYPLKSGKIFEPNTLNKLG